MDNIQLHPTKTFVVPNDRTKKILFNLSKEDYRGCIEENATCLNVEMKNHKRYGEITTPITITADPAFSEVPTQFDCDVANVCISEWEAGNRHVTYALIYRALTGRVSNRNANPSPVQLARIKKSINKLMNIHISLDLRETCKKLGYNDGKPCTISDFLIPARFVKCSVNGQKTTVIEFTAESPLLTVARLKNNQILSFDASILNVPKQKNSPLHIELMHYTLLRVLETIAHPKQMTPIVTFDDVLEKCRIADADPKKKHRVRQFLKAFFTHLISCGVISSFQVNKKADRFHSISFTFAPADANSRQTAQKKLAVNSSVIESSTIQTSNESIEKTATEWTPLITPWALSRFRPFTPPIAPWSSSHYALAPIFNLWNFYNPDAHFILRRSWL